MDNKYVISLEIGSSAVQVAAASFSPDDTAHITVIGVEEEALNKCVRYGRIQNVEEVAAQTEKAIDRLRQIPELADKNITGVYTAVGGRSLHSMHASAELSFAEETLITSEIISRLQDDAMRSVNGPTDILDVIPLRYIIDNAPAEKPVGVFGTHIKAEYTVIVCQNLNSRNLERVIVDRLGMDICGFIVRPLAIADLCLTAEDTHPGCMLVDLGAETTTVSVYTGGALRYLATIPIGAAAITRDLASCLGMVESQAEQTKCNVASAIIDSNSASTAELRNINNYVHARAMEIVANINAQIEFAGISRNDLRSGIIITGRGAKLRNFCKLLEAQSSLPVRNVALPTAVRIASPTINGNDFIAPIAVAMKGAQRSADPQELPCIEEPVVIPAPQPAPAPVKEPEPVVKPAEKEPVLEKKPENKRPAFTLDRDEYGPDVNDPYLLEDDDVADALSARDREQQQAQQNAGNLTIGGRPAKGPKPVKPVKPVEDDGEDVEDIEVDSRIDSWINRVQNRIKKLIEGTEDDSNTLDD